MTEEYRKIVTEHGELIIRRYEERDMPYQSAYLFSSDKIFLKEIGFDPSKLTEPKEWEDSVRKRRAEAEKRGEPPNVIVAELEGRTISMIFLDRRNEDGP